MFQPRVLVTGATGLVGRRLTERLAREKNYTIRATSRTPYVGWPKGVQCLCVQDINAETDWRPSLDRCETVVHLAAWVHHMGKSTADSLMECRRVNVEGTLNLAKQAAALGIHRFVFLSSIKVNGESTSSGNAFFVSDQPEPEGIYSRSKLEAEQGLWALEAETGMEVVVIRPPLVYGPEVTGNFGSLLRWLKYGVPLPFGAINNRRSLVALDNLVDLIVTCIDYPSAANHTFLVSDGEDLSTTQLLRLTASALGVPVRLFPVPAPLLDVGFRLLGKSGLSLRLLESLQVDIATTQETLGWTPPLSVEEGLRRAAEPLRQR
jgi:nucleoside-diphosphate-sugar epimerase